MHVHYATWYIQSGWFRFSNIWRKVLNSLITLYWSIKRMSVHNKEPYGTFLSLPMRWKVGEFTLKIYTYFNFLIVFSKWSSQSSHLHFVLWVTLVCYSSVLSSNCATGTAPHTAWSVNSAMIAFRGWFFERLCLLKV